MVSMVTSFSSFLLPCWNIFPWMFDFCGLGETSCEEENAEERDFPLWQNLSGILQQIQIFPFVFIIKNENHQHKSSHHLWTASPLIIKNQWVDICVVLQWTDAGHDRSNSDFICSFFTCPFINLLNYTLLTLLFCCLQFVLLKHLKVSKVWIPVVLGAAYTTSK